jgi:hypothetical protein
MSTITATYCYFCDAVAESFEKLIKVTASIGTAQAASRLAQQGYYKEAQALMNTLKEEK